jgi:hypothetical protein
MPYPNFFIVGAPKSGTTALHTYLGMHPEVFMGPKEAHFFAPDVRIEPLDSDKYFEGFVGAEGKACIGEASVFYLYPEKAAAAIHEFNPNAKIIVMLRNPVDLLYSLHSQFQFDQLEDIK